MDKKNLKITIAELAFLISTVFSCITNGSELKQDSSLPLIITKGNGGDAAGATVIRERWRNGVPDLVNLSQTPMEKLKIEKHHCILVIGQGAISDLTQSNDFYAKLIGKKVGLYAHLIDKNTLYLLHSLEGHTSFNLFLPIHS